MTPREFLATPGSCYGTISLLWRVLAERTRLCLWVSCLSRKLLNGRVTGDNLSVLEGPLPDRPGRGPWDTGQGRCPEPSDEPDIAWSETSGRGSPAETLEEVATCPGGLRVETLSLGPIRPLGLCLSH